MIRIQQKIENRSIFPEVLTDAFLEKINREYENAGIDFSVDREEGSVTAVCTVKTDGKTGVEMEALTGTSVALLTIYDMCKALDKRMEITEIHLDRKSGGKSGEFVR